LLITFLRPILNIITFPLTVLSLGFFSFLVNVFLVYLLTVFIPNITVHEFVFAGLSFAGFVVPKIFVNTFFAYLLATLGMYGIVSFLSWITR
jgi:putative membrane protein